MQRALLLCVFPLLLGCPPGWGYSVKLDATVPPAVQSAFSSTRPGLLMAKRFVLGELCDPTGAPFVVPYSRWIGGRYCKDQLAQGFENMYIIALSQSDLDWFDAAQADLRCGQTRPIGAQHVVDAVYSRAAANGWGPDHSQTIATGSGGTCDANGNYTGSVLLQLKN